MRNHPNNGRLAALAAGALMAGALACSPARAEIAGTLQCNVASGVGVIVVSQRNVSCVYRSAVGPAQLYNGTINRLGLDIGSQTAGTLTYAVAALGNPAPGALSGPYVGPGFGVTIGTGGGLNALVGGNSINLQPIAATTSTGLNVNAGLGALDLHYVGEEPMMRRGRHHHHRRFAMHRRSMRG